MRLLNIFNAAARMLFVLGATIILSNCISKKETILDYLGQKPPGMTAELFAPGIVSTSSNEHSALAFSPDGSVVLWAIMDSHYRGRLLEMKYSNGTWSKPSSPSFADTTADDYSPSFSVDGKKLFFSSRRTAPLGYREGRGNRMWSVDKTKDGWGTPMPFDTTVSKAEEFAHSISKDGTLYFSAALGGATNLNILKAAKTRDGYTKPVLLPYSINSVDYEDGPYIAPDEDFLIFESTRPEGKDGSHDLYISFKGKTEQWGIPMNMGSKINSGSMERFPRLSPDGKYLFFASNRDQSAGKIGFDIYWIDAKVIDELRKTAKNNEMIEQPLGDKILGALDKGDLDGSSSMLGQWLRVHPSSLDAIVIYGSTLRKQKKYLEGEQLLQSNPSLGKGNAAVTLELALAKMALSKDAEAQKLLDTVVIAEDQRWSKYLYLSDALFSIAKFNLSDEYLNKAMALGPNGVTYYNRGCAYALIGEKGKALEALNKAAQLGYNTKKSYEDAPDLQSLKSDSRWSVLLEKLK